MESGTPPPPPPPPAAEQQPYAPPSEPKAGGGMRALAVVLALVLAFGAAVMIAAMVDINDTPRCDDRAALIAKARENPGQKIDCFDGGSAKKAVVLALGFLGGAIGAIAAIVALLFTITGRRGRLLLQLTALAIALSGLSILIGSL
jgi:hypothetical protein